MGRWPSLALAVILLAGGAAAQDLTRRAPAEVDGGVYLANPATLADQQTSAFQLDSAGNLKVILAVGGALSVTGTVTANAGTNLNTSALALESGNLATLVTDAGAPGAVACASDTASCNFNQLFQRIAQRLTTINATLGSPAQAGGTVLVQGTATGTAPSYTGGTSNALSLDTAGLLRVSLYDTPGNLNPLTIKLNAGSADVHLMGWDAANRVWKPAEIAPLSRGLRVDGTLAPQPVTGTITAAFKPLGSVVTPVAAANLVLKAGPGNLYGFSATSGASAGYVMVYNATAAPGDGTVTPTKCYALAASSTLGVQYSPTPLALNTGITIGFSTTGCFTKSASATAFIAGEVE